MSPLPDVTLSPDGPPQSHTSRSTTTIASPTPKLDHRDLAPSLPTTSRAVSTATNTTNDTVTSATLRGTLPARYPTPPPPDNPLGPAARRPYLPATSLYGGPTIYYSCRPGGECLYDLLDTLPMDDFGVLAWDVRDREDEIFESDNVKDEYKVMHALWARWIVLNRFTFLLLSLSWYISEIGVGTNSSRIIRKGQLRLLRLTGR